MAKIATANLSENIKLPFSDLKVIHKFNMYKNNCDGIESLSDQKGTYYFQNDHNKARKAWFDRYTSHKRDFIVSVLRFRSGHYSLNKSL